MTHVAKYKNPWNRDGVNEAGTLVTFTIQLQIGSNIRLTDAQVRETMRRYLREDFKLTDIREENLFVE